MNDKKKMKAIIQRVWEICHVPSKHHPKGTHAYTHFQSDFDEIRALCRPYVDGEQPPTDRLEKER